MATETVDSVKKKLEAALADAEEQKKVYEEKLKSLKAESEEELKAVIAEKEELETRLEEKEQAVGSSEKIIGQLREELDNAKVAEKVGKPILSLTKSNVSATEIPSGKYQINMRKLQLSGKLAVKMGVPVLTAEMLQNDKKLAVRSLEARISMLSPLND